MQTLSYPNGLSQKPGRSIVTIALVGSLHLILVYAVLVALDIVPAASIIEPTHMRVIDQHTKISDPAPLPPIHTAMARPEDPTNIPAPKIPIDPGNNGGMSISGNPGGGTVTATEVFEAASAIVATHTIPFYPALDRRLDHEGTVLLTVTIDPQGNVSDASVSRSSGFDGLDAAAVSWVKEHWRYKPATRNGDAVTATSRAEVTFRLKQN